MGTAVDLTCRCARHPQPCVARMTQEDGLCELCRPRDCRIMVITSATPIEKHAALLGPHHVRAWFA